MNVKIVAEKIARDLVGQRFKRRLDALEPGRRPAGEINLDRRGHLAAAEPRLCRAAAQKHLVDIVMRDRADPFEPESPQCRRKFSARASQIVSDGRSPCVRRFPSAAAPGPAFRRSECRMSLAHVPCLCPQNLLKSMAVVCGESKPASLLKGARNGEPWISIAIADSAARPLRGVLRRGSGAESCPPLVALLDTDRNGPRVRRAAAGGVGPLRSVEPWTVRLGKTTVVPYGRPARLIAAGPYALSRNPMYVALTAFAAAARS